jgi:hypothetical protein
VIDPRSALLYEVYPQLDAFGVDGVARLLGAFATIEDEANAVADKAFEQYGHLAGDRDMGDFAEAAQDQGIQHYQTLALLKQGVTNLLAAGLYHLFEQHYERLKSVAGELNQSIPARESLAAWPKLDELRLLANTVKHAEGGSAQLLRTLRPDYFTEPILRSSPIAKWRGQNPPRLKNPMGGEDLFVTQADLSAYRDAIREFWEELLPHL